MLLCDRCDDAYHLYCLVRYFLKIRTHPCRQYQKPNGCVCSVPKISTRSGIELSEKSRILSEKSAIDVKGT
jgi:hypothetical protein